MKRWHFIAIWMICFAGTSAASEVVRPRPEGASMTTKARVNADTAALDDGDFEEGSPSAYWTEESLKYGSPICSKPVCGDYGRTGSHYAWFGGVRDEREIAVISQQIQIEETASQLTAWLKITREEGQGQLRFSIDGNTVATYNHNDSNQYGQYREIAIDLRSYADGELHNLSIDVHTEPSGLMNFFIDDVSLVAGEPTAVLVDNITATEAVPHRPLVWGIVLLFLTLGLHDWYTG